MLVCVYVRACTRQSLDALLSLGSCRGLWHYSPCAERKGDTSNCVVQSNYGWHRSDNQAQGINLPAANICPLHREPVGLRRLGWRGSGTGGVLIRN